MLVTLIAGKFLRLCWLLGRYRFRLRCYKQWKDTYNACKFLSVVCFLYVAKDIIQRSGDLDYSCSKMFDCHRKYKIYFDLRLTKVILSHLMIMCILDFKQREVQIRWQFAFILQYAQGDQDFPGIIPLAIKDVFSIIQEVSDLFLVITYMVHYRFTFFRAMTDMLVSYIIFNFRLPEESSCSVFHTLKYTTR